MDANGWAVAYVQYSTEHIGAKRRAQKCEARNLAGRVHVAESVAGALVVTQKKARLAAQLLTGTPPQSEPHRRACAICSPPSGILFVFPEKVL